MSDNQDKSNELPEIIDVDFLPVLDDEDYKREKESQASDVAHEPNKTKETVKEKEPLYTNYEETEKEGYQNYTTHKESNKEQEVKQDTSYASYDEARRQAFTKKKRKFDSLIFSGIAILGALFIGLPIAFALGGIAAGVIATGTLLSIVALGVGVIGLGTAGFTVAAGMGTMALLFLFGSLVALGVGGLGLCIIIALFIGAKNFIVRMNRRRKIKKESEEA